MKVVDINLIYQHIGDDNVTETETLKFETKTIKELISKYYKNYFQDENIKIKYDVIEEDDYSYGRVVITIIRNIKIGEYSGESKNILLNEDIEKVINEELSKYNYKIKHLNFIVNGTTWNGVSTLIEKINVNKKTLRK